MNKYVKNAIILCAGLGKRLLPITKETPKPLIKIHGKPIVETTIEALLSQKINRIYLVVGYLKEQFSYLEKKYPSVSLVYNPDYAVSNNISSIYYARHHLQSSLIVEGDILVKNINIFNVKNPISFYRGFFVNRTDDWCFDIDQQNTITKLYKGGKNCFQMVGISYWNDADGIKLENDIIEEYCVVNNRQIFWDQVPLKSFRKNYSIKIIECGINDAVEIDTVEELSIIDSSYKVA